MTRATELSKVSFYNGATESKASDKAAVNRYLALKVENYKKQDLKAGRQLPKNFVTPEWLNEQFGQTCPGCGDCLRFDVIHGVTNFPLVESNLSADRIDCNEAHHLKTSFPAA